MYQAAQICKLGKNWWVCEKNLEGTFEAKDKYHF